MKRDSISIMKSAAKNAAELMWNAKDLMQKARAGSKAQLEAELLLKCVEEVQGVIDLISDHMTAEELEYKLRMSDVYGKNTYD